MCLFQDLLVELFGMGKGREMNFQNSLTIDPKCQHFRVCGGCKFQHLPYETQLAQKQNFVKECFGKEVQPIVPCLSYWHYRNKMEFSFAQAKNGEKFLGLMKQRGRVENLHECHLCNPWFIEVVKNVRSWWQKSQVKAYFPPTNQGLLRTLIVREGIQTGEKMVMLTVAEDVFSEEEIASFVEALPDVDALILRKQIVQKKTPTRFEERALKGKNHIHEILYDGFGNTFRFRIRGSSFFQPNTRQAEVIYQNAIASAELNEDEKLLDLYCGTGSLGIFASAQVKEVLGIEIVADAVQDAQTNLLLNHITNMEVVVGDVGDKLAALSFEPSVIFVDPPRAGLGAKTLSHLLTLKAKKIVYVSCNPVSQAADCHILSSDYALISLQPIDQFPHTAHVENIALLKRK